MSHEPYDWAQTDLIHEPPSHWRIVPPPVPLGYVLVPDRWGFEEFVGPLMDIDTPRADAVKREKGNR